MGSHERPFRKERGSAPSSDSRSCSRGGPTSTVLSSPRLPYLALLGLLLLQLGLTPPARGDGDFPTWKWLGFVDATAFAASGGEADSATAGLSSSELDLTLVSRFSYQLDFLADLSFSGERRVPGDSAPEDLDAAVERAILRYVFRDSFKLSAGQFHTPISSWRDAYHRGRWLHVAASRPEMAEFDARFLPAHFLGVMAEGTAWGNGWNPSYSFGVGDGRPGLTTADGVDDYRSDGAAVLAVSIEPFRLQGFKTGVAVYADRLTPQAMSGEVDETILSAHVGWSRGINQIVGEYARIRHEFSGKSSESSAFYLEVTYQLSFFRRRMTLYNRVEELRIESDDRLPIPILRATSKRTSSLGVRFDASDRRAFKAEVRQETAGGLRDAYELLLQTSLTFGGRQKSRRN